MTEVIGACTICPRPQMEVMRMAWNNSSHSSRVTGLGFTGCPTAQDAHQLLRAYAARHTLAAGFIAEETDRIQRHVEHAAMVGANHNRA